MYQLRKKLTRVSTLGPNFRLPDSYKKSIGHQFRSIIAKIGHYLKPIKKYIFPNFIAVHYFYIIMMTVFTSILLYPVHNAKYIDILFLATGASTQGGLNTINVNSLSLYQQIIIYITCCLTTPIAIHGSLAFVRLYWFERYFDGIVDFSKRDFKMRRTKTILQREFTRRSIQTQRQRTMSYNIHNVYPHSESNDGHVQPERSNKTNSTHKHKNSDIELNYLNNNHPHGDGTDIQTNDSEYGKADVINPANGGSGLGHPKENIVDYSTLKKEQHSHSTNLTQNDNNPNGTKREQNSSENFQEKLFSGQLVNRDEQTPTEEKSLANFKFTSEASELPNIGGSADFGNDVNTINQNDRKERPIDCNYDQKNINISDLKDKSASGKSISKMSINHTSERFAKRRNSAEITPQDMFRSIQMLRDRHEEVEDEKGPALVVRGPNRSNENENGSMVKSKSKSNFPSSEMSKTNINNSGKRASSNPSRRSEAHQDNSVLIYDIPALRDNPTDGEMSVSQPLEIIPNRRKNVEHDSGSGSGSSSSSSSSSSGSSGSSSGNIADINDDDTTDDNEISRDISDSYAISNNSESGTDDISSDSTYNSDDNIDLVSTINQSDYVVNDDTPDNHSPHFKSNSATELSVRNLNFIDNNTKPPPIEIQIPGSFNDQPIVTFKPEIQNKTKIQFNLTQPPRKQLVKMDKKMSNVISDKMRNNLYRKRSPSKSGYLLKQLKKGERFRQNLKRRLSTGSIEKNDSNDSSTRHITPTYRTRYNNEMEDYFADNESDDGKNGDQRNSIYRPTMNGLLQHTSTFNVNDKSNFNELAQEPDFQKMIYKQWKKEHKGKKHIGGRKGMNRYRRNHFMGDYEHYSTPSPVKRNRTGNKYDDTYSEVGSIITNDSNKSSANRSPNYKMDRSYSFGPRQNHESVSNSSQDMNDGYHSTTNSNNLGLDDGHDNDNNDNEEDSGYQSYYGLHFDDDINFPVTNQLNPLSKSMSTNYLSFQPTVARNSNFVGISNMQKNELGGVEYRSIKLLCRILVVYYIGFHILSFTMMVPWICRDSKYAHIVRENGVSPVWWGFFTGMSTFNDLGLTLTADSMNSFSTAAYPLITMIWFIIIGNTGFPILLRFIIWIMFKLSPDLSPMRESLGFLLDHPRRCFTLLFPESATWWLVLTLFGLNLTDLVLFIILDFGSAVLKPIAKGYRVLDGLFQAVSTRTAGFSVVDLSKLNAATQVSYMLMMYVSVLPLAISIRRTNVYEEQSLGLYGDISSESEVEDENDSTGEEENGSEIASGSHSTSSVVESSSRSHKSSTSSTSGSDNKNKDHKKKSKEHKKKRSKKDPELSTKSFIGQHLRNQLSFDLWFLFVGLFIICICENDKIKDNDMPDFSIFAIIFEIVSAYGTVGLSLGYPNTTESFSARLTTLSKLVMIAMLIRGRSRGLPYSLDRAIILPSERLEHIDHIEDLKLKRRKNDRSVRNDIDPVTGFVKGNMHLFRRKLTKNKIYRIFTQDPAVPKEHEPEGQISSDVNNSDLEDYSYYNETHPDSGFDSMYEESSNPIHEESSHIRSINNDYNTVSEATSQDGQQAVNNMVV